MLRFVENNPEKILTLLIFAGVGWWFWSLAQHIPQMADDFCLTMPSFAAGLADLQRIYFTWSGRMFSHGSIMAANALPEVGRDVVNLIFLLGLGLALVCVAIPLKRAFHQPLLLLAAFGLVIASAPALGEILWWLSGTATYLWPSVLMILWLIPYIRWVQQQPLLPRADIWCAPLFLVGLLSGNTNENTAPAAFLLALGWCAWRYWQTKELPPLVLMLGLGGQLLGTLALLLAPGNVMRMNHIQGNTDSLNFFEKLFRLLEDFPKHGYLIWPVALAGLGLLIWAWRSHKFKLNNPHPTMIVVLGCFVAAGLSYGALMFAPYVEPRAMTGPMIFMAMGTMVLLHLCLSEVKKSVWPKTLCLVLGGMGLIMMGKALARYEMPLFVTELQTKEIAACKANPALNPCPVTRHPMGRDFVQILSNFAQPSRNPEEWGNKCWAKAKGLNGIIGVDRTFYAP